MRIKTRRAHAWTLALITAAMGSGACGESETADTPKREEAEPDTEAAWAVDRVNERLGRGINMGNALDAPGEEGSWGVVLDEAAFQAVADAGFDSVRIPVRWSDHVADKAPYTIDPVFLARVDWAIDTALALDLAVVLDVHHFEPLMDDPEAHIPVLERIWEQLAEHYRDRGPMLVFDLLNEPTGEMTADKWNALIPELMAIIRETNPYRAIVVEPVNRPDGKAVSDLVLPEDDHLIASFHYYEPFEFTHQGASWVDGAGQWTGKTWPDTAGDVARVRMSLDAIQAWQETADVPIYVGELGAIDLADQTSRMVWTATVVDELVQRGWSFAYWMLHRVDGGNFGIYDPKTGELDQGILRALLNQDEVLAELAPEFGEVALPGGRSVLLDDFEDALGDLPEQCHLAAAIAAEAAVEPVGGEWWPFANLETTISSHDGAHINTWEEYLEYGAEFNGGDAVGEWGYEGRGLAMVMDYQSPEYPYAGVSTHFSGEWNQRFFDFADLTAVSFMAKGSGVMRADFLSDAAFNSYPEGDNWGFHGVEFVLSEEWTRHVLFAEDFTAVQWSPSANDDLTWDDVKEKIFGFQFAVSPSYGRGAEASLAFYVDNVILHGLTMEHFENPSVGMAHVATAAANAF